MAIRGTYGGKNQCQHNLIKGVNLVAEPLSAIENGMCYMLCIDWIIRCLGNSPKTRRMPLREFDEMTGNIVELRQVAQNFCSYHANVLRFNLQNLQSHSAAWIREFSGQAEAFVEMMSRKARQAHIFVTDATLMPRSASLDGLALAAWSEAYLVLFFFESGGKRKGHALAMVSVSTKNNLFLIYDPNRGLILCTAITDLADIVVREYGKEKEESVHIYIWTVQ